MFYEAIHSLCKLFISLLHTQLMSCHALMVCFREVTAPKNL